MENNEAILLARKVVKESIYNIAQFEHLNVTFPETETILDGGKVLGLDDYEINVILNLKRAWLYILNNYSKTITIADLKELNKIIGQKLILEEGEFRTRPNTLGGYDKKIPPLSSSEIQSEIDTINKISDPIKRTCEWISFAIPNQLFWDANKRTAFLMANKILIAENVGVLSIKQDQLFAFNVALNNYYNNRIASKKQEFINILEKSIELTETYKEKINDEKNHER